MIKSKDAVLILGIVIIASIISFTISNIIFKVKKVRTTVEIVEPITSDFPLPDQAYFNSNSIDPTVTITIGGGSQPNPFNNNGH